ncbi:MAG: ankyrin repeat domain-containing protein [Alphaproteobacteria bacterium]|nr:ankyrin repeat domain-containing protein [Alphaproteobacteria bacterium]
MKLSKPMFSITKPIMLGLVLCLLAFAHTKPVSAQEKSIFDILKSEELKLFGYYVVLSDNEFRDILTENDVSAIIDELQQFQPKELNKFLHHTEDFLIYADDIATKHDNINRFYVTYQDRQINISPTIDEMLLREVTSDYRSINIGYNPYSANEPLFMQLADTNNNNIIPLIQYFLDNGVAVNARNPNSNKTIFTTVGTLEIAQFLLANGADPTIVMKNGTTPLIYAIHGEDSNELIKFLIDIGVDLHVKSSYYGTALERAKKKVKSIEESIWRTHETDDESLGDELLPAQLAKAETVVRIIEQALEAEKKP